MSTAHRSRSKQVTEARQKQVEQVSRRTSKVGRSKSRGKSTHIEVGRKQVETCRRTSKSVPEASRGTSKQVEASRRKSRRTSKQVDACRRTSKSGPKQVKASRRTSKSVEASRAHVDTHRSRSEASRGMSVYRYVEASRGKSTHIEVGRSKSRHVDAHRKSVEASQGKSTHIEVGRSKSKACRHSSRSLSKQVEACRRWSKRVRGMSTCHIEKSVESKFEACLVIFVHKNHHAHRSRAEASQGKSTHIEGSRSKQVEASATLIEVGPKQVEACPG